MFKITIIDMDTNKTLIDAESNCIIGAIKEKDGVKSLGLTRTDAIEIAETMAAISQSEKFLLKNKTIRVAYTALNLMEESAKRHAE